ncbi:MAG: 2-oxoacid:ferredoxin oxidoreductase subunit alpha [Nitrososphaeria archaeon]
MKSLNYLLGGPQGGGLETSSQVLSWAFAKSGYGVISDREYYSNIVGRHSYIHARVDGEELPKDLQYPVKLVGAMDAESVFTHFQDLDQGSYLIYNSDLSSVRLSQIPSVEPEVAEVILRRLNSLGVDQSLGSLIAYLKDHGVTSVGLSFRDLLSELQKRAQVVAAQASRYISTIIIGATAALVGIDPEAVKFGLQRRFRSGPVLEHNTLFSELVSDRVKSSFGSPLRLDPPSASFGRMMIVSGNDIVAIGKIVGGLRMQTYYPITPAADESFTLEEHERLGDTGVGSLALFQTEDELAAVNAAIGAALTGARVAAATSGPGFDLMVEGLGWAGMNETPVVITYYQRGGPSTGQPTRGGQSDLLSTVFASHGEYPRVVLASGDHEEAFWDAIDALNYSEMFQTPVIHLVDKFLANTIRSVQLPDLSKVKIERGSIVSEPEKGYKRFSMESPVSPRAFLGTAIMWYTGDEHNEEGHISEEPENRRRIMEKRMGKLEVIERTIPEERRVNVFGDESPDVVLYGWGFVKGAALGAIKMLRERGVKAMYVHVRSFVPYPRETVKSLYAKYSDVIIDVEHNITGQAAVLASTYANVEIRNYILKYTGRPIYSTELVDAVLRVMKGERRVVLEYGA